VITLLVRNTFLRAIAWLLAIALPIYVGSSRLYQGMHHPTDMIGSALIATGSLLIGLLACRTAGAVAERRLARGERDVALPSATKVAS
jgi:undecaprenyl-diphosphatase